MDEDQIRIAEAEFTQAYLDARYGLNDSTSALVAGLSEFDILYKDAGKIIGISIEIVNNQIRYRKKTKEGVPGVWMSRKNALEELAAVADGIFRKETSRVIAENPQLASLVERVHHS